MLRSMRAKCTNPATGVVDGHELTRAAIAVVLLIDPTLDLASLRIILNDEYDVALREASAAVGMKGMAKATRREAGSGAAMLLSGESFEVLAAGFSIVEGIFGEDPDRSRLMLYLLHHELCHAHDAAVLRRVLPGRRVGFSRRRGWSWLLLAPLASNLWSEYSANRRAAGTLPQGKCIHAPLLAGELPKIEDAARVAVEAYRQHRNADRVLEEIVLELGFAFQLLGYVLGAAAGSGETLSRRNPEAVVALRRSFLSETWVPASQHLGRMFRTSRSWRDLDEMFAPLEELAREAVQGLGLRLADVHGLPLLMPA
jgi:hypothetical protein